MGVRISAFQAASPYCRNRVCWSIPWSILSTLPWLWHCSGHATWNINLKYSSPSFLELSAYECHDFSCTQNRISQKSGCMKNLGAWIIDLTQKLMICCNFLLSGCDIVDMNHFRRTMRNSEELKATSCWTNTSTTMLCWTTSTTATVTEQGRVQPFESAQSVEWA